VERQHAGAGYGSKLRLRTPDLGGAGQEAQHVASGTRERRANGLGDRRARLVPHLDRMRPRVDLDHRTVVEEARDGSGLERRRHHDDAKVRPRAPRLPRERQREVGVQAALVELVEHDRPEAREQRVGLQAPREHALRGHQQPRVLREAPFEADLKADLGAERPPVLVRDPARDRARGDPPRLQQEDRPVRDERGRHARRLAGARRRREHERAGAAQRLDDARDVRVDGKGRRHPPEGADGNPPA
jgi:hypothetical protein